MTSSSTAFDLDTYLYRIGYRGERQNNYDMLAAVQRGQAGSIAFENLDPWLRRPVVLDIGAVYRKLVQDGRGGFCFEHNLLLGHALRTLGFTVLDLAARVRWNVPDDQPRPRTHMVLVVTIGVQRYLVDTGFGGHTLTAPLRMDRRSPQVTPHGAVRLQYEGGLYTPLVDVQGGWRPLYSFDLQPQRAPDYEMACWYLCNHPSSVFRGQLMAARPLADGRLALRNRELTFYGLDGRVESETLPTAALVCDVLSSRFGIRLDGIASDLAASLAD
jgi:N-hydroxyarylamine O-acetyltransferase